MSKVRKTSKKKSVATPQYRAPALEKGLDIIELLASEPDGLSQGDIARILKRSVSEIFRMLNCLQQRGYVALLKPADVYVLTLKLFELSHRYPPMRRLIKEALPLMTDIARKLDQSCHLAVCHGGRILVVAQVDSPGGLGFSVRMGAQLDLLLTASGLVMLAFASKHEHDLMLSTQVSESSVPVDIDTLERRFSKIRKRGFDECDSLQVRGVRNLSFPVRDFSGHAIAALAVPFLRRIDGTGASTLTEARNMLRIAASSLSTAIGAPRD